MQRKLRILAIAVVVGLAVILAGVQFLGVAAAASNPSMKVEYHRYALSPLGLAGVEGECDSDAQGAVAFCETIDSDNPPNKFHVSIQDDLPVPVGGHWEFRSRDGIVLWEGSFCKEENDGPIPLNATHFVVRVDIIDSQCGTLGTNGWVVVTWRWTPEAPLVVDPVCPPCPPCEEE